jgi:hypothetical protein
MPKLLGSLSLYLFTTFFFRFLFTALLILLWRICLRVMLLIDLSLNRKEAIQMEEKIIYYQTHPLGIFSMSKIFTFIALGISVYSI